MTIFNTKSKRIVPSLHEKLQGIVIPERTILAIDASWSLGFTDFKPSRIDAARQSALSFVRQRKKQGADQDKFAVVSFAESARCECGFTSIKDIEKITEALQDIWLRDWTNIRIGLVEAEHLLANTSPIMSLLKALEWLENKSNKRASCQRRKRIILLSDGCQNKGRCPLPVAHRLKKSGVEIDCIGIAGEKSDPHLDEELLRDIASIDQNTGLPRYRFISDTERLVQHYEQLATGLTR